MALIEINRNPSRRELNAFAFALATLFAVAGSVAFWRAHAPRVATGIWIAGALLLAVYLALPRLRRPICVGWMRACAPLGWLVSHTALAVVYFLVITPIGLAMRLAGRDPMKRRFDPSAESHWLPHQADEDASRYFRQF